MLAVHEARISFSAASCLPNFRVADEGEFSLLAGRLPCELSIA
jgi:hypothetical protein